MEAKPDFVVVAVNRNSVWSVAREWIKAGFPVLLETPVGHTEEELKEAWEMSLHGAKIQVAEQYFLQPLYASWHKAIADMKLIGNVENINILCPDSVASSTISIHCSSLLLVPS